MCIRLLSNSLCFVVRLIDALFLVNSFFGRYNCSRLFLTIATIFSGSPVSKEIEQSCMNSTHIIIRNGEM